MSNQFQNIDKCSNEARIRPDEAVLEASANFAGLIEGNGDANPLGGRDLDDKRSENMSFKENREGNYYQNNDRDINPFHNNNNGGGGNLSGSSMNSAMIS